MADALYLKVLEQLEKSPESGGVVPQEFGFPLPGPNPMQDTSVPPDYLESQQALRQSQQPPEGFQFQLPQGREQIGLLQRPQQFVSELLQGGDPFGALLEGRATKPSLGYALFEEAQAPGFQLADLPAFAVDVLTDPLTYILPPLIGRSYRAVGSLFGRTVSGKFFTSFVEDAIASKSPRAAQKVLARMWKPPNQGGISMTNEWFAEISKRAGIPLGEEGVTRKVKDLGAEELSTLLSYMKNIEYEWFQPSAGLFGSALNRAGMHLAPVVTVLRKQGGVWGQRLAKNIESMMNQTSINYGRVANDYLKYVEDLGLVGPEMKAVREASTIIAEAGGRKATVETINEIMERHGEVSDAVRAVLMNPELYAKAEALGVRQREILDLYSTILGEFKDAGGKVFHIQTDTGKIPFKDGIIENYVPHIFEWENLKRGKVGYDKFVRNFMKKKGLKSYAEAQDIIETLVKKTPRKFGNIEHARLFDLGGYKLDPLEYLPQWIHRTEYRMNFARQFGVEGVGARQLFRAIKQQSDVDPKWLEDVQAILFDRHHTQFGVSDLVRKITGFQVVTKMGFGSSVLNASQSINTAAMFGIRNFMEGVANAFTTEGQKLGALAYNRASKEAFEELMTGAVQHGWASKYLDATGFNFVERWNRFFAANVGVASLRNWSAQLARYGLESPQGKRYADRMRRAFAMTDDELVHLASGRAPGRDLIDRAALLGSENTQHATKWHQLPKIWKTPEARIALQYKNFAYNQARFMYQQIVGPAMEFLATSGKSGDIAPLLRTIPLFTTAGQTVRHLRDIMKVPIRGVATGDWKARAEWLWEKDEDEWFSKALKDTLMVGSFGIVGDVFTAAERNKIPAWILGPTVADVAEGATRGLNLLRGNLKTRESMDRFITWYGRRAVTAGVTAVAGPTAGALVQALPYDVTYGDIDLSRFVDQLRQVGEEFSGRR